MQQAWRAQSLHVAKEGQAVGTRGRSSVSLELPCLVRSKVTWGLEPCCIVCANNVIYECGVGLGARHIN